MSAYFFQINRILEKTPKEIADNTLYNLILVLEELWNHSRYQDNKILKEYVKILKKRSVVKKEILINVLKLCNICELFFLNNMYSAGSFRVFSQILFICEKK
jgi:hypothetical protein